MKIKMTPSGNAATRRADLLKTLEKDERQLLATAETMRVPEERLVARRVKTKHLRTAIAELEAYRLADPERVNDGTEGLGS